MDRTEGAPTPPLLLIIRKKAAKPSPHRQTALRRILTMLTTIGRNYVPDLDSVDL
jgi:hypothetical protein